MNIVEYFTASKTGNNDLNEDVLVMTDNFVGVLDGATSRGGLKLGGMSTGRFASTTVASAIHDMDADITAPEAVLHLSHVLKTAIDEQSGKDDVTFNTSNLPSSALLLYSKSRQEIWSIADSPFTIDGVLHEYPIQQESVWTNLRGFTLRAEMAHGKTVHDLQQHDPTWDLLMDSIGRTRIFANHDDPEFGFGVLTGQSIPVHHIRVTDAKGAKEIIMTSDGYLKIEPTWEATEKHLQDVIEKDPLMIDLYPQAKGVKAGNTSFDDRSYIRITL